MYIYIYIAQKFLFPCVILKVAPTAEKIKVFKNE